nr:MAG TPA: hypothetical protein [Caudoviricetes sp.]
MTDYMLTVVYDYGKLEHSAPLVDTWKHALASLTVCY